MRRDRQDVSIPNEAFYLLNDGGQCLYQKAFGSRRVDRVVRSSFIDSFFQRIGDMLRNRRRQPTLLLGEDMGLICEFGEKVLGMIFSDRLVQTYQGQLRVMVREVERQFVIEIEEWPFRGLRLRSAGRVFMKNLGHRFLSKVSKPPGSKALLNPSKTKSIYFFVPDEGVEVYETVKTTQPFLDLRTDRNISEELMDSLISSLKNDVENLDLLSTKESRSPTDLFSILWRLSEWGIVQVWEYVQNHD